MSLREHGNEALSILGLMQSEASSPIVLSQDRLSMDHSQNKAFFTLFRQNLVEKCSSLIVQCTVKLRAEVLDE